MYLLVNKDNIIVGSAINKPSEEQCSKIGQMVYKIERKDYHPTMIGQKLVDFEVSKVD